MLLRHAPSVLLDITPAVLGCLYVRNVLQVSTVILVILHVRGVVLELTLQLLDLDRALHVHRVRLIALVQ